MIDAVNSESRPPQSQKKGIVSLEVTSSKIRANKNGVEPLIEAENELGQDLAMLNSPKQRLQMTNLMCKFKNSIEKYKSTFRVQKS